MTAFARRMNRTCAAAMLRGAGFVVAVLALSACGSVESTRTAEETLALAAAGLSGMDRYGFNVRTEALLGDRRMYEIEAYEGEVTGHRQLKVWPRGGLKQLDAVNDGDARMRNPAGWLARVEQLDKSVEYVPEEADGSKLRLRIRLAPEAARAEISAAMREALLQVTDEADRIAAEARGENAAELRRALAEEVKRSRAKLERMLLTLEVDSGIELDIERSRLLPVRMEESTTMRYETEDGARSDHRVTHVAFEGYDGRP